MSNDIKTGNMPVNIAGHNKSKPSQQSSNSAPIRTEATHKTADSVSMTDQVTHLQEIEAKLAAIPVVNDSRVSEIKQSIADGTFEINPERIASKLIDMENGNNQ